jgi:hypothetical protein
MDMPATLSNNSELLMVQRGYHWCHDGARQHRCQLLHLLMQGPAQWAWCACAHQSADNVVVHTNQH